jgi:aryl-alcohol dehydrogenase-like predicted oxidoreductase
VSTLALGTMTFGNETDEAGSHAQLDAFVEAGGTLIDTADVYSRDNLGAAGLHLSPEETERLDAASDPAPADYPYGGPGVDQRARSI